MAAMTEKNDDGAIENAEDIIERFGGIRPMASKMNVPVTTVQGWKKRNVIPGNRREEVIRAAQINGIDLAGLMSRTANENTFSQTLTLAQSSAISGPEKTQEKTMEKLPSQDNKKDAKKEPLAAQRPAPIAEPRSINDEMMQQIKRAQSMTLSRSVWFTILFVAAVVVIAAVLLWPSQEQISQHSRQISQLEGDVAQMRDKQSLFSRLIPDDLEQRFGKLQHDAQAIQDTVAGLSTQVEAISNIANDVLDPNATLSTRIQRIEDHVSALGAPAQLTQMLQKVEQMEVAAGGDQMLSGAVAELNKLIPGIVPVAQAPEEEQALEQAILQAQQTNPALGQALEGVAPEDMKAAALLLGLAQFRSSLNRSAPFKEDLALLHKMLGENDPELQAAIDRLAPKAESGVLTPAGLKGQFQGLAGDIVVASLKGEDVSVQEKAKARLNEVLSVEKNGELITGTDTQAKVARAQKMLDAGDVEGAIAELQSLEGEAATTAQPFIDEAQLTLLAEQLQGMFTSRAVARLSSGGGANVTNNVSLQQLIGEVKKLEIPRHVVGSPDGFMILEPAPKILP